MDYRELANKYLRAETSLEEEQLLREHSAEASSDDERAVGAILSHNAAQREQGVNIRLRQKSSSVWSIASVLSLCVVAIALTITLRHSSTAEPNIYCYVNGEAIYDAQLAMNETACLDYLSELDQVMNVLTILEN